ncbi:UDP-galactose 4'-epimerase [Carabus blaptoides fortunei]
MSRHTGLREKGMQKSPISRCCEQVVQVIHSSDISEIRTMADMRTVFVTGGAGYIGSHCVIELLDAGYEVVAIDNFVNSVDAEDGDSVALKRVEQITGKPVTFYKCDLLDKNALEKIFQKHKIDCVIHFAAIKAVGESMQFPLLYYKNNLIGMINLLEVMADHDCYQLVFSSSCTVYGEPVELPITESHGTGNVTNVYGRTKFFIEEMLKDITVSNKKWNIIALRYFNPVGAHPSGLIGEDPTKAFTNLMPYISQVAMGKKPVLTIFGGDYETFDGTGVRDYIHVMDLATGHVAALNMLQRKHQRLKMYNLGTGAGVSVLQLVKVFEQVTGTTVPYEIVERRTGDITSMYANAQLAEQELAWKAKHSLEEMCEDFWRWQTMNPNGYRTEQTKKVNGHT